MRGAFGKRGFLLSLLGMVLLFLPVLHGVSQGADSTGAPVTILAIGDSLTAGYNLPQEAAFPAQLERHLRDTGLDVRVRNAGVSGDTTAMGLDRLDWVLGDGKPDLAIVELGANDALRGVSPDQVRTNLSAIIEQLKSADVPVLLAGMKAPRNMGGDYVESFDTVFPDLAKQYDVAFYPFFLKGVIDNPELVQRDGLHPTKEGVAVIVENMAPLVRKMLREVASGAS